MNGRSVVSAAPMRAVVSVDVDRPVELRDLHDGRGVRRHCRGARVTPLAPQLERLRQYVS